MLSNYRDTKCEWGYITLCDRCKEYIKNHPEFPYNDHIHIDEEVIGYPCMPYCEACHRE